MWKQFRAHSRETRLALLFVALAGAYAIGDAVVAPAPAPAEPGFIDTVLGSRAVVAAVRIAVIFAAAFIAASVVALIARGQWLTRVGPIQVSDRLHTLEAENQRLESSLSTMKKTFAEVQKELSRAHTATPDDARFGRER